MRSETDAVWRVAVPADIDRTLELMRAYYSEDGYPFDPGEARSALHRLLHEGERGRMWVIDINGRLEGYAVLTFGYSLEYRGVDAFVDELYLSKDVRGAGCGRRILEIMEETSRALGVRALHLEVERDKAGAQELYRKWGFEDHQRYLMTKVLT